MPIRARHAIWFCLALIWLAPLAALAGEAKTLARCGAGWIESIDGYRVLHLKGTPYEIGYQHGALLKEDVRQNMHYLLDVKGTTPVKLGPVSLSPRVAIESIVKIQERFVPAKYFQEMEGLAAAADLPVKDVRAGNFIPELFHCSGFAVMNSATKDGTLYHGRVLDYAVDWQLQDHAVLIVCEPAGEIPFVNVSYAGFIGSVTGMNARHVSIGEMGGRGLGHWEGEPMALFVRDVLQTAADLDAAIAVFRDAPRTCEYYYVIADGTTNRAVGMEATWNKLNVIQPGESHPLLPAAVKDAALLSAGGRYQELVRRTQEAHGQIDAAGTAAHGLSGCDEVELAQRAVRAAEHRFVGGQRLARQTAGRRAAVSAIQSERAADPHARPDGPGDSAGAGRGSRKGAGRKQRRNRIATKNTSRHKKREQCAAKAVLRVVLLLVPF